METPGLQLSSSTPPASEPGRDADSPANSFPFSVFIGPDGVRAAWRLAIFIVMSLLLGHVLVKLSARLLEAARVEFPPFLWLGQELALLCAVFAPAWVLAQFEHRRFADYGLPARQAFGRKFWIGVLWGFVALTALLESLHLSHAFNFGALAISGPHLASYAVAWAALFLVVGIFEEFSMRGYALFTLTTGMGFWPSAVLVSAAFGALHLRNPGEDWTGGLAAACIGLFWCLTIRRTGSLWFAIGFHASWDYAESFIYGVPDSGAVLPGHLLDSWLHGPAWLTGGSVGPEGSALVFVVIGAMFVLFHLLYRQAQFPHVCSVAGSTTAES